MSRERIWVGTKCVKTKNGEYLHYHRAVFRTVLTPTVETHSKDYDYCTGPFKTVRAAKWMVHFHWCGNPHRVSVEQCERLAKEDPAATKDLPKTLNRRV